jgi:hypothetical protein
MSEELLLQSLSLSEQSNIKGTVLNEGESGFMNVVVAGEIYPQVPFP